MNAEAVLRRSSDRTTTRENHDPDRGDRQRGSPLQPSSSLDALPGTTYTLEGFNCPFVNERPITFLQPLPWVRVCMNCKVVAAEAALLPCCHTLCDWCLEDACYRGTNSAQRKGGNSVDRHRGGSCPLDSEPFVTTDVANLNFPVQYLLRLRVHCFHANLGCSFQGELGQLQDHQQECLFKAKTYVLPPRSW
ncbi:hypothetical protein HPB49_017692 [Dermacentor silvarum]|uniref:Uncharacterized protein n=1 Tax=Dermacentor silvarum TaxID=543639 RepID=A0ACB8DQ39_DERSI|nr:hypothetical protein HPB49_017692 [Dermacentor silvarum]